MCVVEFVNMYNMDIKQRFFSQFSEKQIERYRKVFIRSQQLENKLGKDISRFNLSEMEELFNEIKPVDLRTAMSIGSIIVAYSLEINKIYGSKMGVINPLRGISKDWYKQFIIE